MSRQFLPLADAPHVGIPGSKDALHWIAFHRKYNGAEAAGAIFKFGGRLYVDSEKYLAWMATGPRISPPVVRNRLAKGDQHRTKGKRAMKPAESLA
jgi:hypothetical protein